MAHGHNSKEKVVYVGDSRIRQRSERATPPDYTAYPGKSEAFIPNFLLKEWMVGCVMLVGFLVLTISEPAPLGYPADPTNAAFIPVPDWYFLFLYQLLKMPYASGDYVVLGIVGLPGVLFGALLLAPFLDTGKERRFYRRPIASAMMFISLIGVVYLTVTSWAGYQEELKLTGTTPEHIVREEEARDRALAGLPKESKVKKEAEIALVAPDDPAMESMKVATCLGCHGTDLKGQSGPSLRGIGDTLSEEQIMDVIKNGKQGAKGNMPPMYDSAKTQGLSDEQINGIAAWLAKQKKAE
ncbi:menaquinol-cytochrome C reductase [Paenibacillus selenitireducens]|uniref:Menaquinol-cytochrome C reductase n=1 Tax=Paenibacillus selenitireducens TaxID=1324314 RepID=A0A1T2XNL3_9BACL|nr:menaquinol-cytochrome c reductase cytochrome b/c subunit [Paenibacillus selenitireducens]OPA81464.1 menaquinol-cytochrome C reductase [Paenibacillus selenitireducens]